MMPAMFAPRQNGSLALPIPLSDRKVLVRKLNEACNSDYHWHLKPVKIKDDRIPGEEEMFPFLREETRKICLELGVKAERIEWFREVDTVASSGVRFEYGQYCPENDALAIIYGASQPGTEFRDSLKAVFRSWIKVEARKALETPQLLAFSEKSCNRVVL
ncbi:hypothetical protein TWF281_004841 [Arthrobotrys megalospora]